MMTLPFVLAESEWSLLDALSEANSLTSARSVSLPSLFLSVGKFIKENSKNQEASQNRCVLR